MSKHLRALGKLKKNVLGLSSANLDTEITSLGQRRDKLPTLIYEKTDEATAAEVLSNMVDKYHLKEASLIKKEVKDKLTGNITTTLNFPSSGEVTTFINTINEELSAKCETQIVIDSAKKRAEGFFSVKIGAEPISGGIDGDTTSSILNYQKLNENAYNYTDSSKYLHFINLVEKGELKLEFEVTNPHFDNLSYTYTLNSEEFGLEPLSDSKETPDGAISNEKGNIVIIKSDKENVYNVFTNLSATGTPVTTTTYDLNKESFSNFVVEDKEGLKVTYSLTFKNAGLIVRGFKIPTEKSFEVVERLALAYRDTYIKNYTEYLPDFTQLKYFLNQELEYEFGKYESRVKEPPRGDGEEDFGGGEISDIEKLRSKFTVFTNDIVDGLTYLFYGNITKSKRIDNIERYRKNISIAVLNLGKQNDNSKNILSTFGESNLIFVKDSLNSLNKENDEIDTKITTLQTEKTTINEFDLKRREQLEDLEEILGGVDTTFIDKAGLSEGSIISAESAHTETLKIYSGARVDKIIKESIAEGKFEVEVFELTDIEAKLLLDAGYYIKETTEVNVIDPNNIAGGRREEILTTWTINWESANSISGEDLKEPLP
jgi:hypothetical protein